MQSSSSLEAYLESIRNIPLMSPDEEKEYSKRIYEIKEEIRELEESARNSPEMAGEIEQKTAELEKEIVSLRNVLVERNLKLVVNIAKKYIRNHTNLEYADLIQSGNLGLIRAAEKFDYRKNFRFSTYATWHIRSFIRRLIIKREKLVRLPEHVAEHVNFARYIQNDLRLQLSREATYEEIAEAMEISKEKAIGLLTADFTIVSLDDVVSYDSESPVLVADAVEDKNALNPMDYTLHKDLKKRLKEMADTLDPKELMVLALRKGKQDKIYTLDEIGKMFDPPVSREWVRIVELRAIKKMRRMAEKLGLTEFLIE
ncbi:hypothetical protein DRJ17_05025 [Candidatus Woesearchaeota archaeon]|nr:MAG: hypothetical protein DRJ17_05025 [Candidatus Woesearchaeota archaeon]